MQSPKKAFLYGFLVWLLTLLVSMMLFPIKKSSQVLFDSIMPVVLSLFTIIFLNLYFRRCVTNFLKEGVWLGVIWLVINILFDLPMFSYGPMQMSLQNYMADVGLTYLLLPVITIGAGFQAARLQERMRHAN